MVDYLCPSCAFIHAVTDRPVKRLKALLKWTSKMPYVRKRKTEHHVEQLRLLFIGSDRVNQYTTGDFKSHRQAHFFSENDDEAYMPT